MYFSVAHIHYRIVNALRTPPSLASYDSPPHMSTRHESQPEDQRKAEIRLTQSCVFLAALEFHFSAFVEVIVFVRLEI